MSCTNGLQYVESLDVSTSTNTSYESKLSLTTSVLSIGTYEATFNCAVANVVPGNNVSVQFSIDGDYNVEVVERSETTVSYKTVNSSYIFYVSGGTRTLDIDYRSPSGSTAYIKQAQICIKRIA